MLALLAAAYAVDTAITDYHDRIALKGLDGKPSPIALEVSGESLVVPANLIRSPIDRRGGPVDSLDLLLLWPSLDGFSEERAAEFPRCLAERAADLRDDYRARDAARFDGPARRHLQPLLHRPGNGRPRPSRPRPVSRIPATAARSIYFEPRAAEPYVVRCLAEDNR